MEELIKYDQELFLVLNNLGNSTWDEFWLFITNKYSFIPMYAILLYLIYYKMGARAALLAVLVVALMITFTDQITNVFKHSFERLRPCREIGVMENMRFIAVRCGRYGYFSGHSSNSMAAAVFAGLLLKPYFKKLIYILLFWSFLVAYSRIYVGVHYPLDIISGLLFGAISGLLFYKLYRYLYQQFIPIS